jgi:hypothetical protein
VGEGVTAFCATGAPGMIKRCPTASAFGSVRLLACCSAAMVVLNLSAIENNVSPG